MYPITAAELPQRRVLAGERHERHLHNAGPRNGVHRQTHTVDRDGAVQNRHGGNIHRHCDIDQSGVSCINYAGDCGYTVYMPLDDMTAHQIGRAHGTFQVDAAALLPLSDQRAPERCLHGVQGKPALHNLLDGQTGAIDGDALALLHAFVGRLDTEFHAVVQRDRVHPSYCGHDSGKHSRRSKTNNVSEPSGRRSTTTQRGASASGDAGIPAKAATAPSPSQTGDCTQYRRSTRPSARSLAPSAPPPSHNNDWIPASRSCAKACPSPSGRKTRTPLASSTDTFDIGASGDATTQVGTSRAVWTSDTPRLSMARRSNTMRTGGLRGVSPRAVSWGLSVNAVVPTTAIASNPARSQWTWSRASGPEIHCDRPPASAIRPSMDVASLSATQGRSVCCLVKRNGAFSAAASSASRPICVSMPARFSTSTPPRASASGSRTAATTRRMPAARIASVQGGVLP